MSSEADYNTHICVYFYSIAPKRNDIDVFIEKRNGDSFIEMISSNGYYKVKVEYTTDDHTVWKDSTNHVIDLHLFEFGKKWNVAFQQ